MFIQTVPFLIRSARASQRRCVCVFVLMALLISNNFIYPGRWLAEGVRELTYLIELYDRCGNLLALIRAAHIGAH